MRQGKRAEDSNKTSHAEGGQRRRLAALGQAARTPLLRFPVIRLVFMLLTVMPLVAQAVEPSEILPDARLEARARALSTNLRCLVCQNQSIDDSNAPLAKDLRVIVRERLTAGDSDAQVMDYLVARYGDFILLSPPLKAGTVLLWAAPFGVLLLGLGWLAWAGWRRRNEAPAVAMLSEAEAKQLRGILDKK